MPFKIQKKSKIQKVRSPKVQVRNPESDIRDVNTNPS